MLEHLVLDFNGTLACNGQLLPGMKPRLKRLARSLQVHVLTADTFGRAARALRTYPCRLVVLEPHNQDRAKALYVRALGVGRVVAIGNGGSDRRMLKIAALGIAVLGTEGASVETLRASGAIFADARDALDALLHPLQLTATLRTWLRTKGSWVQILSGAAAILQLLHHVGGHKPSGAQSLAHSWG